MASDDTREMPLYLETFRDLTPTRPLERPTTPNFFQTPLGSTSRTSDSLICSYQSLDSITTGGSGKSTQAYSNYDGSGQSTRVSKLSTQASRVSDLEKYLTKLRSASQLAGLIGLVISRAYKTYAYQCLYRFNVVSAQQELLTHFLLRRRILAISFRRWLQLLQRRTTAELNFLLRKATAESSALSGRLRKAIDNQASLELLLRQQRKEMIDLKEAVWSVWQNELVFADQRHNRLAQCVRELNSISYELEKDRREKEPLLTIEFDDFFHRLIKHHKIRHRSLREMTS